MNLSLPWLRRRPRNGAEWVVRLQSGAAGSADRSALAAWLETGPEHRRDFERACATWDLAHGLAASAVAQSYLTGAPVQRRAIRPRSKAMAFGLGGALAAAMLALTIWPDSAVHTTGAGEIATVALEDGSTVWLNADSRLRVDFSAPFRRVVLERGEAFFKVAHDTSRPFVVEAAPQRIVVTGTEFDVRRAREAVEVSVAEGHVKVEATTDAGQTQPITALSAGDDARFAAGEIVPAVARGGVAQHKGAWREGKIYLDDTQLASAVDEINRYSQTKLVLADDVLRHLTISGVFRTGDTDSVLFSLHELYRLEARREPGRIVLYRPAG
jgi:transmembrane sensor